MARKTKKKKVKNNKQRAQRKQKKQQRRTNRVQDHPTKYRDGEEANSALIDDMLTLFPYIDEPNKPHPEKIMENIFMAAADTGQFIDEPEFADIGFDPMETPALFAEAGEKLGFDDISQLSEEQRYDAFTDIVEEILADILTDEIEQDILAAIEQLRNRLRKSKGRRQDVTNLAALQFMLSSEAGEKQIAWSAMGLIQAMVQRSMSLGLDLASALVELGDVGTDPESIEQLLDEIAATSEGDSAPTERRSGLSKIVDAVQNSPMLSRFLTQQADDLWDEGLTALFSRELVLDIFTETELERAAAIFHSASFTTMKEMGLGLDGEADTEWSDAEKEEFDAFIAQIDRDELLTRSSKIFMPQHLDLLEEIFDSPQRQSELLDHLTEKLAQHMEEQSKWTTFISQLRSDLANDPDDMMYNEALMRALFGEIKPDIVVSEDEEIA